MRPHALVVGGTGMLRGVALALAAEDRTVSVVARSRDRLDDLAAAAKTGRIVPVAVDWEDDDRLRRAVANAIEAAGPIRLAVCWIHSTAPRAPRIVADTVGRVAEPCRFFQVLGSSGHANRDIHEAWRRDLTAREGILHRQVRLGRVVAAGGERWLSHDEIAEGVLEAIRGDREDHLVGTEP